MEKRALSGQYRTVFTPLPVKPELKIYVDAKPIRLPFAEDFPNLHYHDRYEIGICESGEGLFLSEGEYASVSAGDVIFIPPGNRHYSRSLSESAPCICRFVYLQAKALEACFFGLNKDEKDAIFAASQRFPAVVRKNDSPREARELCDIARICINGGRFAEQTAFLRLASFILENADILAAERIAHSRGADEQSPEAKTAEYIYIHYNESQTVGELAALCHLSESQLRRRFVAEYGVTPIAYRSALRCRVGAELLLRTGLTVAEIAERVGYGSGADLYRAFSEKFGVSPSEYRKKSLEKSGSL